MNPDYNLSSDGAGTRRRVDQDSSRCICRYNNRWDNRHVLFRRASRDNSDACRVVVVRASAHVVGVVLVEVAFGADNVASSCVGGNYNSGVAAGVMVEGKGKVQGPLLPLLLRFPRRFSMMSTVLDLQYQPSLIFFVKMS